MDDHKTRTERTNKAAEYAAAWVVVIVLAVLFGGATLLTLTGSFWK
jgi:hypothetical protein